MVLTFAEREGAAHRTEGGAESAGATPDRRLAREARIALLGRLAGSLIHEVSQPLASILVETEALLDALSEATPEGSDAREAAARIHGAATDAARRIAGLRAFASDRPPQRDRFEVAELLSDTLRLVEREATEAGVAMRGYAPASSLRLSADRVQIQQILANLLLNAIQALAGGGRRNGRVVIAATVRAESIEIRVWNNGPPVDGATAERLFDPFFTTKADGMGLGLAICRSIATAHGGTLTFARDADAHGTCFRLTLPAADSDA